MSERDHDLHAMVGAYVADALDDDDRAMFEEHLSGCESCRRESAEFAETLGELTWLTETPPPPALRSSILGEIATVRPLPPEHPVEKPTENTVPRPWPAEVPEVPDGDLAHYTSGSTDELTARRQRRLRRAMIGLVAAALVLVVGLGGWVVTLVNDQRNQQVAEQQITDLLTAPDAKLYATQLDGANVSYVISKERNQAVFLGDNLQSPGSDKVYQLWTIQGQDPTSQGLVTGSGSVTHWFDAPVDEAQVMAVTVEPAGGSPTPTTTPLAVVEL
jgi:hypothetical protein